jgi:hypothetical protein
MERRFIVNSNGEAREQKLKSGEPTRKFIVSESGETKIDTFTEEDRERLFLAKHLDREKFFNENPDLRQDFLKWCEKKKK